MIGLSRLTAQDFRGCGVLGRSISSAQTVRVSPVTRVPVGRQALVVALDMPGAEQVDPTKSLRVVVEVSADGISEWWTWCGFTTQGNAERAGESGYPEQTMAALEVWPAPPAGLYLRQRMEIGATDVTTGSTIRVV